MVSVVMHPGVVGLGHEVGVCGASTVPTCAGGDGIGLGSTRTWKYGTPFVLSTNATCVPSVESAGDVLIWPPVCVTVWYANATQGVPPLHGVVAPVYRLLIPTTLACVPEFTVSPKTT